MGGYLFQQIYGKMWVCFCLNTGKRFFAEVLFWIQQKEIRFLEKTGLGIFEIEIDRFLRDRPACFYVTIAEEIERFQVNFETSFLKN